MSTNRKNLALLQAILDQFPSQIDFAEAIGVSESFVSFVLRRRRTLNEDQKVVWAKALCITEKKLEELIGRE